MTQNPAQNPLLQTFATPHGVPPFDQIKTEHYQPAIEKAIEWARADVEGISTQAEPATFANTIVALEQAGAALERVTSVFFNLLSAETSAELQEIAQTVSPWLTRYQNDVMLDEALFERVKTVWEQRDQYELDAEQSELLRQTYRAFERNGAALNEADKSQLRELDEKLAQRSLQFGDNVLAETNAYELYLEEKDLAGLPESLKEAAAEEAREKGEEGKYRISLQMPSFLPFMTYADRRDLRQKLFLAYGRKAFQGGEHDNQEIVLEIARLRYQRARLLGFKNHADYVLAERMAGSPAQVHQFLEELLAPALPAAREEMKELEAFARERDGLEQLQRWDVAYYSEKLKQKRYALEDEKLKPYFELDRVIQGAFGVAHKLYGLSFERRNDMPLYHPDVHAYEVKDQDGQHLAIFYGDFHPREGKRGGAWMTLYRQQHQVDGQEYRPHVSIVCNFSKPTAQKPSLLTFQEVLTLFHEFGHALHAMLARGRYASLTSPNVFWDFVELPSQVLENWCYEQECLDDFARHYQTDEPLPPEWVAQLRRSATFMEGRATVRQVSFSRLDMAWHDVDPTGIQSVGEYEQEVFAPTDLLPPVQETNMSCSFGHIFQGGYSAGYYSYKWAEVLDADAFEFFQEKGLFNPEVAQRFRHLLEAGGSIPADELYRRFRGRDADPKALLRRAGLLDDAKA
jgi:peptidyl-dipeptidase Dcp